MYDIVCRKTKLAQQSKPVLIHDVIGRHDRDVVMTSPSYTVNMQKPPRGMDMYDIWHKVI